MAQQVDGIKPLPEIKTVSHLSSGSSSVRVTYFGGNCLWLYDDVTHLMIDPFFTRPCKPGKLALIFQKVQPDKPAIIKSLADAGIRQLDALLFTHTHYDHALDGAEVARCTAARMVGSASVCMLGQGAGLPADQLFQMTPSIPLRVGNFTVTFFPSRHTPFPFPFQKIAGLGREISQPLTPPAHIVSYREGGVYAIFLEHAALKILVTGSGGFVEHALDAIQAHTVFLSVGGLDISSRKVRQRYWEEMVVRRCARRVFLTHWDDFTQPDWRRAGMLPLTSQTVSQFLRLGAEAGIETRCMPKGEAIIL